TGAEPLECFLLLVGGVVGKSVDDGGDGRALDLLGAREANDVLDHLLPRERGGSEEQERCEEVAHALMIPTVTPSVSEGPGRVGGAIWRPCRAAHSPGPSLTLGVTRGARPPPRARPAITSGGAGDPSATYDPQPWGTQRSTSTGLPAATEGGGRWPTSPFSSRRGG